MDAKTPVIPDSVWEQYAKTKDPDIRNDILMAYLHIVKVIVGRAYGAYRNYAEQDDLISTGTLALMNAIENFDHTRGIKFETYASIRIRGSIIDYMRKQDWVPRNLRKSVKDIENAYRDLQNKLGREPTDDEVAEHLGMDQKKISRIMGESHGFNMMSLEDLIADSMADGVKGNTDDPEHSMEKKELRDIIAQAIDALSEKERIVISLYYYEEMKSKDIAVVLGLSESRISQIHSRTLLKLRLTIEDYLLAGKAGRAAP